MTPTPPAPHLAPPIRAALDALRRRIRRYVWLEGLGAAACWLGAMFWLTLAADWLFEPGAGWRVGLLVASVVGLIAVVWWTAGRKAWVPISPSNLAMLLERRFPDFCDSLLTAVALAAEPNPACNPVLLARTCQQAEEPLGRVRVAHVLNVRPLLRRWAAALALLCPIAAFALASPEAVGVWLRRTLLLSDELWPRHTRLVLEGFQNNVAKVARGADLEILIKADLSMPLVPETVEVRYRGQHRLRRLMTRVGRADPQRDRYQEYSYTFRGVLTPIEFDVAGGDVVLRGLRIDVVENPTIVEMVLDCHYPAYMDRPPRSLPVTGPMPVPAGTGITVRARSNKELVRVAVESGHDASSAPPQYLAPSSDPRCFQYSIPRLTEDRTLLFTLWDTDGIKSREPVRLTLAAVPDQRPELSVQMRGIGSAVTPQASIPATGRVTDDHGIARIWFEYAIDAQQPKTEPIASPPGHPTEYPLHQSLDLRPRGLRAGQKLLLCVKAEDRCSLTPQPNVGTSDRWLLDVVTPEQLRTLLQSRELVLRQRFESIMREVTETRDGLVRVSGTGGASATAPTPPAPAGVEPGQPAPAPSAAPTDRLSVQRTLHVQWAQQNSRKNAHETGALAEAFAEIREELIHNRIDTEELKSRLEDGIARPLRQIADQMFPEFDRRLDHALAAMGDPAKTSEALKASCQQIDEILLAMRQVLSRMIELEDYHEAVELLKGIIQSQQELREQTERYYKQRRRELLEK